MHCILSIVFYAILLYVLYSVWYALYLLHCILYIVFYALHSMNCIIRITKHFILRIVFSAFWLKSSAYTARTQCSLLTAFFSCSFFLSAAVTSYYRVLEFCLLCYIWPDKGVQLKKFHWCKWGHGMRRPGSKHPHGHQQNFCIICMKFVTDQPPTIDGYRAAIASKSLSVNLLVIEEKEL